METSTELTKTDESTSPALLPCWRKLTDEEKAFAAAYAENGYSVVDASEDSGIPLHICRKMLNSPVVRKAVTEIQEAIGEIEFLNDKWVKEQLLRLYPKLIGEEAVPFIDNQGVQVMAKKFHPEVAMRVLEYVAPKAASGKGGGVAVQVNIDLGAMGVSKVDVNHGG